MDKSALEQIIRGTSLIMSTPHVNFSISRRCTVVIMTVLVLNSAFSTTAAAEKLEIKLKKKDQRGLTVPDKGLRRFKSIVHKKQTNN